MKYIISLSLLFATLTVVNSEAAHGFAELQGRRSTMEDAHCIIIEHDCAFFGLFDGHGGRAVADAAAHDLYSHIKNNLAFKHSPEKALSEGYISFNNNLNPAIAFNQGATAVSLFIDNQMIYVTNTGDSRAVLSSQGIAIALSEDHKPNRLDEYKRIEQLGGYIAYAGVWRVQGVLALSRALGDLSLSPFIIPNPEITVRSIQSTDEFVILACDGVWDVLSNQEAVDIITSELTREHDLNRAAQTLVITAYKAGNTDNISALIIDLHNTSAV